MTQSVTQAQAEVAKAQGELTKAKAEGSKAKAEIERVEASKAKTEAERAEAAAERARVEQARAALDEELQRTRHLLERARAESARMSDELERFTAEGAVVAAELEQIKADRAVMMSVELEQARAERASATAQLERALSDHAAISTELDQARAEMRGSEKQRHSSGDASLQVERLLATLHAISDCTTVGDVLAGVANGLTKDFGRVAIFSIRDNRLKAVCHAGFEPNSGISKVMIPMTTDSVLTQTLASNDVRTFTGKTLKPALLPPFGGSPTFVVTAPVVIQDQAIAVIYADDAGPVAANASGDRTTLVDLLRQYALGRLELLTAQLKILEELRAYAKLLIDEIEYVYAADASAKKSEAERQTRLSESLRCARQMYEQRATLEGPAALAVLEEQLRELLDARASTPFGRDLAAVAKKADAKQASQAS
jgi:hypothetical protein